MVKKWVPYFFGYEPAIAYGLELAVDQADLSVEDTASNTEDFFELALSLALQNETFRTIIQEEGIWNKYNMADDTVAQLTPLGDWMKERGLNREFKELTIALLEQGLTLDPSLSVSLQSCIRLNWPLTLRLVNTFPAYIAKINPAQLLLRVRYLRYTYQMPSKFDEQINELKKLIARTNMEDARLESRLRNPQTSLAEREEVTAKRSALKVEYDTLQELKIGYNLIHEAGKSKSDRKNWVRGLQKFILWGQNYRFRYEYNGDDVVRKVVGIEPRPPETLPRGANALQDDTYIYELLGKIEKEDQKLRDRGYIF